MYPKRLTQKVICDPQSAIVETKAGKVRGLVTEGTYIFRGIKYADAKRWRDGWIPSTDNCSPTNSFPSLKNTA